MTKQVDVKKVEKPLAAGEARHPLSVFDEMDRVFDSMMHNRWPAFFGNDWPFWREREPFGAVRMPRVDVMDRDDAIVVTAELPGIDKEKLDISLSDTTLTIHGSTHDEQKSEEGEYFHREIRRGEVSRTISLPAAVDGEHAKASFENGVLEITLPKVEKAERLEIKVK